MFMFARRRKKYGVSSSLQEKVSARKRKLGGGRLMHRIRRKLRWRRLKI